MGRFVPDEKRRHRLAWLAVGGLFALAVVEAVITDRETRLAYEEHQAAFYAMAAARGGGPSGTFGVRQIVTRWRADEPGVEAGGIDRCPTCHLGVDDLRYDDPTVPALFRTHPRRERLLGAHPVDDLGCTACHRGQGWATTDAAHSGWELVVDEGQERWRRKGDPRWPAPIYAIGEMVAVVIDDRNDRFDVTIGGDEPVRVTLEHRAETPAEGDGGAVGEERLLADLRSGLERALPPELASTYRGAARRRGERFHLGYEIIPGVEAPARSPSLRLDFPTREMARILGFGDQRHVTA